MLLNRQRQTARQNISDEKSSCPECDGPLIGKRGEIITWHWAHKSLADCSGGGVETEWHMRMKEICLEWPDWQVEFPVKINDSQYFLDAHNPATGEVLEFVHSLSPFYESKHKALHESNYGVTWIVDGAQFAASSRIYRLQWPCTIFNLLKPAAFSLHQKIGVVVHYDNVFWRSELSMPYDPLRKWVTQTPSGARQDHVHDRWGIAFDRPALDRLRIALNQ